MNHPYVEFEETSMWKTLEDAIAELVKNRDLVEQTARPYIVGYLCKALAKRGEELRCP